MIPRNAIEQLSNESGCHCGKSAVRVVLYNGCEPADLAQIGGGGLGGGTPAPNPFGAADLEIVCNAEGEQIFVQVRSTEDGYEYINPATDELIKPMVDFFPCPPVDNAALIDSINALKECMCAPCPDGAQKE